MDNFNPNTATNLSRRRTAVAPYQQSASALRRIYGTRQIGNGPAIPSPLDTTPSAVNARYRQNVDPNAPESQLTPSSIWKEQFRKRGNVVPNNISAVIAPTSPLISASSYLDRIIGGAGATQPQDPLLKLRVDQSTTFLPDNSVTSILQRNNLGYQPLG